METLNVVNFSIDRIRPRQRQTPKGKIGVVLSNLGTPDATDYWSMRRYLREFLSDRRVIETPRWLWMLILHGMVLTTRPRRKGRDYDTIWNHERNESPLKTITRSQAKQLRRLLNDTYEFGQTEILVEWGMRYGNPSLETAFRNLSDAGCDRILLVPLYPQYSAATSATACDKAFEALAKLRRQPYLRVAPAYYEDLDYIEALAQSVETRLSQAQIEPEVIVASFHGMPKDTRDKGDPYYFQCVRTGDLLRRRLNLREDQLLVTFQSRFGPAEWLQPYTDATIKALAASGVKRLAVITPGFSADCLETIEEIGFENSGYFLEGGGEHFVRIDCLNDSAAGIAVIDAVVRRELAGWI